MKFKVIKEYGRFYLAESPKGYKKTFNKNEYKPDSKGYIIEKEENNFHGNNIPHPPINTPWGGKICAKKQI